MDTGVRREEVLRLILCQLSAYGFSSLSQAIATHTGVPMTADSNSRLEELVSLGMRAEKGQAAAEDNARTEEAMETEGDDKSMAGDDDSFTGTALDLEAPRRGLAASDVPDYRLWYQTTHKGIATTAGFSNDGRYIATGSMDASLKLIEVDRLRGPSAEPAGPDEKPVIRAMYNHELGITGLAFHPNGLVLASCSSDRTIKLFDLTVVRGKHAFKTIQDNFAYRSIAFHPSGEYIAAGGDAPEIRLYDVKTSQGYLLGGDAHTKSVTQVRYSNTGSLVASSSSDGTVKLWDGQAGKCVRTIADAHGGRAVTGVSFSKNRKYLLTTGLDSRACLWDVGTGRLACAYEGAALESLSARAVFSFDEAFVMAADERSNSVVTWDAQSGELLKRSAHHHAAVTWIEPAPNAHAFMSCCADHKIRYWSPEPAAN
ncbi:hypothetical protein EC988_000700 [Linderina pennispora]|nr:hypothetical protein EC988_000700 [Linderina pennispora]